jgi:SAM-dependent methyltransferase
MNENYYQSKESVEEYIKLAKDVNGQALIEKLKAFLSENAKVLEIGSGPGTDFKLLKEHYEVVGSDFSNEFLVRLKENYKNDLFLQLDAAILETEEKFDGIYSNKVLQHLNDNELQKSASRQAEILFQNGIICHSFWKGEGDEVFKGMLVNYQTDASLRKLFEGHFEILLLEEYPEFEDGDSILLIAKKK